MKRQKYREEIELDAIINLVENPGLSCDEVARRLGTHDSNAFSWVREGRN